MPVPVGSQRLFLAATGAGAAGFFAAGALAAGRDVDTPATVGRPREATSGRASADPAPASTTPARAADGRVAGSVATTTVTPVRMSDAIRSASRRTARPM